MPVPANWRQKLLRSWRPCEILNVSATVPQRGSYCLNVNMKQLKISAPLHRSKRVTWISSIDSGDDSRAIALQKAAIDCGYNVSFICSTKGSIPGVKYHEVGPVVNFFWHGVGFWGCTKAVFERMWKALKVLVALCKLKPNIVITQEPDSWLIGVIYKRLFGAKVINDLQEIYEERSLAFPSIIRGVVRQTIRMCMKLCSTGSDAIIHVSEARRSLYLDFRAPSVTVSLYPPAQLAERFPGPGESFRRELGWDGRFVMVHAGALRPSYAGNELIRALLVFESLEAVDFVMVVLGGVHGKLDRTALNALVRRGKVQIYDEVPHAQVYQYIRASDAGLNLVLPIDLGHVYAQPRKLFEYMALGVPVIGSDVPTIAEVIRTSDCGWIVDATDPTSIVGGIQAAARDIRSSRQKGENGQSVFRKHFNWESQIQVFQDLLQHVSGS
jgi:glycosyltransferase involved in cell wall biosynthesis